MDIYLRAAVRVDPATETQRQPFGRSHPSAFRIEVRRSSVPLVGLARRVNSISFTGTSRSKDSSKSRQMSQFIPIWRSDAASLSRAWSSLLMRTFAFLLWGSQAPQSLWAVLRSFVDM